MLSGCAWASRNVYREPEAGDLGEMTFVLRAPGYRSNVWLARNPTIKGDPKAISVFDDSPVRTVKAVHKETVVLSLEITNSVMSGGQIMTIQCGKMYEVPFSFGDLRVTLLSSADGCAFLFKQRGSTGYWAPIKAKEWTEPLPYG